MASAQSNRTTLLDYATGSEYEDYLRALQVAGLTEPYPWSIRAFSPREIRRLAAQDTAGPWKQSAGLDRRNVTVGAITLRETFNSAYPYGANDGPVWAGRGLTSSVTGGFSAVAGPLSATFSPVAFRAENRPFALLNNGLSGSGRFANGIAPDVVDYPQRFGDAAYSVFDPGNSSIRFDSRLVTFGVSTANEWIGPATEYPFLLGNNAAGFPHVFAGSGEPLNLWIGRAHARLAWGKVYQSSYSLVKGGERYLSATSPGTVRLATYGEFVFIPRGVSGLEIGAARFFHVPYTIYEPSRLFVKKPFRALFLSSEYAQGDSSGLDNQLASVFFRWVLPHSGFEFYGERGYEDQFYDRRDFVEDPDHEREYMLGFQKVLKRTDTSLDILKGELVNYQLPTIARVRQEGDVYVHAILDQGHTSLGQLLGSSAGVRAAAASTVSWTHYAASARTTFAFRRIVRAERGDYAGTGLPDSRGSDVIVAAALERMRLGERLDLGAKVEAMQDFNRNFSHDVANLNLQVTVRLKHW